MSHYKIVPWTGQLISGDNIHAPGYTLLAADHATIVYPVDGWHWYDTVEEALAALAPDRLANVEAVIAGAKVYDKAAGYIATPPNRATVESKLRAAVGPNATYLALGTPTAAQNTAQVRSLTRQVNALLRLQLPDLLNDMTGT